MTKGELKTKVYHKLILANAITWNKSTEKYCYIVDYILDDVEFRTMAGQDAAVDIIESWFEIILKDAKIVVD